MKYALLFTAILLQSVTHAAEIKTNFLDELYNSGKNYSGDCSVKSDLKIGAWITNFNTEYALTNPTFMLAINPAKNGSLAGSFPFTWLLFEGDVQNKIENPHSFLKVKITNQKLPVVGSEVEDGIQTDFIAYEFDVQVVENKIKAIVAEISPITGGKQETMLSPVQVKSVNSRIEKLNQLSTLNFKCKIY